MGKVKIVSRKVCIALGFVRVVRLLFIEEGGSSVDRDRFCIVY